MPSVGEPSRCPRCAAQVLGDYKFCPTCAFRLRVDRPSEPPLAVARSPWKRGFLVATVMAVVLACALVGIVLYHPSWLERPLPAEPLPLAPPSGSSLASPAITVDEIKDELVELNPAGFAETYPVSAAKGLSDTERAALQDPDVISANIWYALRVMKYEVTCGQYQEFLDDIEAHRDRIPEYWQIVDGKARVDDVDLFEHIPPPWQEADAVGERSWHHVDEAARNLPVTHVSSIDAIGFAQWASKRLGLALRLPFVMEWTRAARGGSPTNLWPWGKDPLIYACNNLVYWGGAGGRALYVHQTYSEPLGAKEGGATAEGLYGCAGNVSEWAVEHDVEVVPVLPGNAPYLTWKWKDNPRMYACGGSFRSDIDDCKVESRVNYRGSDRTRDDVGFRLVVSAE